MPLASLLDDMKTCSPVKSEDTHEAANARRCVVVLRGRPIVGSRDSSEPENGCESDYARGGGGSGGIARDESASVGNVIRSAIVTLLVSRFTIALATTLVAQAANTWQLLGAVG